MTPSDAATLAGARLALADVQRARDDAKGARSPAERREAWKRHQAAARALNLFPDWAVREANGLREAVDFIGHRPTNAAGATRLIQWALRRSPPAVDP